MPDQEFETQKMVWDGKVPISLTLAPEEVQIGSEPDPLFLHVPRIMYLSTFNEQIYKHFGRLIPDSEQSVRDDLWLESDGIALKWHFPFGVLYDLLGKHSLPWRIYVHFKEFPETTVLRFRTIDALETHFLNTLKEADHLKHRSAVMNALQKRDHKQLWNSLLLDKFDQFWTINKRLMEISGDEGFRNIPFRLHQPTRPYVQRLIGSIAEDGSPTTLHHLLAQCVPHLYSAETRSLEAGWRCVVHGVEPALHTPLQWLAENMAHPDNFLHVCLQPPAAATATGPRS